MKKQTLKKILSFGCTVVLIIGMTCGLFGCGRPKVPDTAETLEVFIAKLGYGADWCEEMLNSFKEQAWVREKYPNLQVLFEFSADRSAINTRLNAGEGYNTVDLIMTDSVAAEGPDRSGNEFSCNLTDVVYKTNVPGEDITVYDKLLDSYKKSLMWYGVGESAIDEKEFQSYNFNWASGMQSIVYNEELLKSFGYDYAPRTTAEFIEACNKISNDRSDKYGKGYAILWSSEADYSIYLFDIWWAQYEGYENYYNYWNGLFFDGRNYVENSAKVFEQIGRKKALEAMTEMLSDANGYRYPYGDSLKFKAAQKNFINGDGVFMSNGDYLANEMKDDMATTSYTLRMMKTPIISSIIDKTPTINNEETLRTVISRIDSGYSTVAEATSATPQSGDVDISGVSEADYQKIVSARGITACCGTGHNSVIPTYAAGKEIAFDFLRFLATDTAQEIYMNATGGASLPFKYNVKEKNPELYNTFYDMQKDRLTYQFDTVEGLTVLPSKNTFPLSRYGGLGVFSSYALDNKTILAYPRAGLSAEAAWQRDIEYWQSNSMKNWRNALILAGLN